MRRETGMIRNYLELGDWLGAHTVVGESGVHIFHMVSNGRPIRR